MGIMDMFVFVFIAVVLSCLTIGIAKTVPTVAKI